MKPILRKHSFEVCRCEAQVARPCPISVRSRTRESYEFLPPLYANLYFVRVDKLSTRRKVTFSFCTSPPKYGLNVSTRVRSSRIASSQGGHYSRRWLTEPYSTYIRLTSFSWTNSIIPDYPRRTSSRHGNKSARGGSARNRRRRPRRRNKIPATIDGLPVLVTLAHG